MKEEFGVIGPPWWNDAPVILVGGGPSLLGFEFGRLRGLGHVIGLNQAMFDAPVSAGVTADRLFVRKYYADLITLAQKLPLFIAIGNVWLHIAEPIPGATYLREHGGYGISEKPGHVYGGSTTGFAALNVAVLKRARRILLLGYDYRVDGGRHHYHDRYTAWFDAHNHWTGWATQFDHTVEPLAKLGVEVVNASPESAISAFPTCTVNEGLAWAGGV